MWFLPCLAFAETPTYQSPPPDIAAILDARRPPAVRRSPDQQWMVLLEQPALPPISEVAAPVVKVAGIRLDPDTNGPARENPFTAASLRPTLKPDQAPIPIPI